MTDVKKLLSGFVSEIIIIKNDLKKLKRNILKNIVVPEEGKFILPPASSDPVAEDGRMYYNTTTDKGRICENSTWRDI